MVRFSPECRLDEFCRTLLHVGCEVYCIIHNRAQNDEWNWEKKHVISKYIIYHLLKIIYRLKTYTTIWGLQSCHTIFYNYLGGTFFLRFLTAMFSGKDMIYNILICTETHPCKDTKSPYHASYKNVISTQYHSNSLTNFSGWNRHTYLSNIKAFKIGYIVIPKINWKNKKYDVYVWIALEDRCVSSRYYLYSIYLK